MPIYEYECRGCEHRFERFLRPSSTPDAEVLACPSCHSNDVQRLLSVFAVNSEGTKQAHLQQARKLGLKEVRDKKHAEIEQDIRMHDDHNH